MYLVKVALAGRLRHKFFDALIQRAFDNQIWVRPLGIQRSLTIDRPPFSQNGGSAEINKIRIFHYAGFRALANWIPLAGTKTREGGIIQYPGNSFDLAQICARETFL